MPDFKMGNPAKTVISQSGTANPTWGTGAPTGCVIQVKSTTKTDADFSHNTSTVTTITGLTVTITPKSTSSKILILGSICFGRSNANSGYPLKLFRDSTEIGSGDSAGSRPVGIASLNMTGYGQYYMDHRHVNFLDSPNTTSAITYSFRVVSRDGSTIYINRSQDDADAVYSDRGSSTITVMEIAG